MTSDSLQSFICSFPHPSFPFSPPVRLVHEQKKHLRRLESAKKKRNFVKHFIILTYLVINYLVINYSYMHIAEIYVTFHCSLPVINMMLGFLMDF